MPAGIVFDEQTRVFWLDTNPGNLSAPTVAEISAGLDLTGYLAPDGLAYNVGNTRVPGADLLTSFDNESMGRHTAQPSLMLKRRLRGSNLEAAWTKLHGRKVSGCLVVCPFLGDGGSVDIGDDAYVFPTCETGSPLIQNTAVNVEQRFHVDMAVGQAPVFDAVVA